MADNGNIKKWGKVVVRNEQDAKKKRGGKRGGKRCLVCHVYTKRSVLVAERCDMTSRTLAFSLRYPEKNGQLMTANGNSTALLTSPPTSARKPTWLSNYHGTGNGEHFARRT